MFLSVLQQDMEAQPHVFPSYPLHVASSIVLLFTITSWSNLIRLPSRYTSSGS